jgi:transporter family-2 protein
MLDVRFFSFFSIGILAGSMLTIQSVLNASLAKRVGTFGSLLVLTLVGISLTLIVIAFFPQTSNLRNLPRLSEWYLYVGAFLGLAIMLAPIILIARIGATSTLTAMVMGQLFLALVIDHFGLFAAPKIEATSLRLLGVLLVVLGAFLISR